MRSLLAIILLMIPLMAFSHGGGHPTRYVAVDGVDEGECSSPSSPCAGIAYAVAKSSKGDTIKVAAGDYAVDELDVFYLLSSMVKIKGGYSTRDSFKSQQPQTHLTTIVGIPAQYREQLAKRGFRLLQDAKGQELGLSVTQTTWLQRYSKLTTQVSSAAACENGLAGNNPCHNIDRVAHMPVATLQGGTGANDIWGFVDLNNQREYVLITLSNGTAVVDVSNAEVPDFVGHIPGAVSNWRDVKVYQFFDDNVNRYRAYAYVTTEGAQGLQIIDLTALPEQVSLATNLDGDFLTAHNVYIANVDYATGVALEGFEPYLYVAGSNQSGGVFRTYDLVDPLQPHLVAQGNAGYIHDATSLIIDDARTSDCAPGHNPCELFIDFNENTVDIWDMTSKSNPLLISSTSYSQVGYVHSGWWSQDKQTIFIQDENDERNAGLNTTMRAMDIRDLRNPRIVGTYTGPTRAIDHNGFAHGDYYYMSNYRRGLVVIDVSDPTAMTEVGFFDTFAVPEENIDAFNGAWGTYPFLPSGNILVSDIEYGLWVLKLNENDGPAQPSLPTVSESPPQQNSSSGGGGAISHWLIAALSIASCYAILARRRRLKFYR